MRAHYTARVANINHATEGLFRSFVLNLHLIPDLLVILKIWMIDKTQIPCGTGTELPETRLLESRCQGKAG